MDCGFGGANNGCNGAGFESYLSWLVAKKQNLASEAGYPYTSGTSGTHGTCRSYKKFNQGFTSSSSTFLDPIGSLVLSVLVKENKVLVVSS